MKKALARLTDLCAKRGSYSLEAALTLPVLIICVVSLVLVVKIAAVSEGVCFTAARELREQSLRACSYITDVSLCKNMEKQVLEEQEALTDFRVLKSRVRHAQGGIEDLLTVDSLATFTVAHALGVDGRIDFAADIMGRAFTGTLRDSSPLEAGEFAREGVASEVVVFPRYGERFHRPQCRYVKTFSEKGSSKLVMDRREARMRGYTPCQVCGGSANDG